MIRELDENQSVLTVAAMLALALLLTPADSARGQGLVPQGRAYEYTVLVDSSVVNLEFETAFADSSLYDDVDSTLVRFDDVIPAQWSYAFADSLRRYWRNDTPGDPIENEIQLVGFERPGLRVFYDPPLPWVPSLAEISVGLEWVWVGRTWPDALSAGPDTLHFRVEAAESVEFQSGSSLPAWKLIVQESPDFPVATGGSVDLTGWPKQRGQKRFEPLHYWYGAFYDGGRHQLRLRDDEVILRPDLSTPVRRESMGGFRGRFLKPASPSPAPESSAGGASRAPR